MIITDQFVMLNLPKTGSSFSRKALKQLYRNKLRSRPLAEQMLIGLKLKPPLLKELLLPNSKIAEKVGPHQRRDQHGTYEQIPLRDRLSKPVFSIVRDPLQRALSTFEFRFWVKYPPLPEALIQRDYPAFPNLTFEEFVRMLSESRRYRLGFDPGAVRIGTQSLQFIQMFFKKPAEVLSHLSDAYLDSDQIFEDMAPIQFIKQENLRAELKQFLTTQADFDESEVAFIDTMDRVLVTRRGSKDRSELLTDSIIATVKKEDRLIYRLLAAQGIHY